MVWDYLRTLGFVSIPWSTESVSTGAFLPVGIYVDVADKVRYSPLVSRAYPA